MQAPVAAVVLFGLYMLALLAYGVATYRDCPAEAASLQQVSLALDLPTSAPYGGLHVIWGQYLSV